MEIKLYGELTDKPINGHYTKIKGTVTKDITGTINFMSSTGICVSTNVKFKIKSEKDERISVEWLPSLNAWAYNSIVEPK